ESDRVYDKETVQGYARKLGFFAAIAGDVHFEEHYFERLQKLGPADLKRVAARYLRVSNMTVQAQLPEPRPDRQRERSDKVAARLRAVAEAAEARADSRATRPVAAAPVDRVVRQVLPSG